MPVNAPKPVNKSGVSTGGVPVDSAIVEITNLRSINIPLPSGVEVHISKHDRVPYEIDIKYKGESLNKDTGNMKIKQKLEQIKNIFLNK